MGFTRNIFLSFCFIFCGLIHGQSIQELINTVNLDSLELTLSEFSGEIATNVNGNEVTILNRQQANNDLAAEYLVERFESMNDLNVNIQNFNTNGKNVIATQLGETNPDDIYIVCAHYDTVADYCADDNATGTAAVLEMARILSKQCTENTIVYALWDEEEIGLLGSQFYANQAAANNENILGVLNMDMMGYDGDNPGDVGDNEFDIDFRDISGSVALKDDIINVLNSYSFSLSVIEVDPGTVASDHASFWAQGYSAVLVGESWETNDQTPFYHNSQDRLVTLDLPYFHEMSKLVTGWLATKAGLLPNDSTVNQNQEILTANQDNAAYQWLNLGTNSIIPGAINQTFMATENGTYAVDVTFNTCTERSEALSVTTLDLEQFKAEEVRIYPNPSKDFVIIDVDKDTAIKMSIFDASGKLLQQDSFNGKTEMDIERLAAGVYFFKFDSKEKTATLKFVKE